MTRRLAACIALIVSSSFGLAGCLTLEMTDPAQVTPTPIPSGVVVTGDAAPPSKGATVGTTIAAASPPSSDDAGLPVASDAGCPTSPDTSAPETSPPSDDAAASDDAPPPVDDAIDPGAPDAPSDDVAEPDPPPPVGGQAVCPSYDPNCAGLPPPEGAPTP